MKKHIRKYLARTSKNKNQIIRRMNTNKKYVHEISDKEWEKITKEYRSFQWLKNNYSEPPWCSYPDAVDAHGCWSLVMSRVIKNPQDCGRCAYRVVDKKQPQT